MTHLLPRGRLFTLLWTIPDAVGGLTSAALHRSRAFAAYGGADVDILTFDNRVDYPAVTAQLRERGELCEGMRIVNLWDWLREHEVARASHPKDSSDRPFTPLRTGEEDAAHRSVYRGGALLRRERLAVDGRTVLQTDYFRQDGSLLASDREDADVLGTRGGRSIVVCDRGGYPARSWGTSWALYRWWLDQLTAGAQESYLIADSKPVSRFLRTYRRPGRVTVTVVHGSHLVRNIGPWGPLRPQRAEVLRHLSDYDAVIFLTDRQRRDVQLRFGRHPNSAVIPNSRRLPDQPVQERPPGAGALLCALSRLKRPEHAVRAVTHAQRVEPEVSLNIFGDGSQRASIERLIAAARAEEVVHVWGWRDDARARLAQTSFLLMTSRSEGFGLVLLEAMGAGCIPIAYDIRYGPRDLIVHGGNGFLVRSGHVRGLARAIITLQRMPREQVAAMRDAARRTAEQYTDEAVLGRWAGELTAARERNQARPWVRNGRDSSAT